MTKFLGAFAAAAVTGSLAAPAVAADALPTVRASIVLRLQAAADRAFPMFDPVNETRWSPDWHPTLLGDGRVVAGLVFTTPDEHGRTAWLLDRYDPRAREIRYVITRPSTLTTIDIVVVPDGPRASVATVSYTRTALEAGAVDAVQAFARHFPTQGPHWESAINAALAAESPR
ncbi:MAG TPA: hypothetical protein VIW69_20395 [Candidatus Elarobacter sp.]